MVWLTWQKRDLCGKERFWENRIWSSLALFTNLYKQCRKSRGKLQMGLQTKRRRSKPTLTRHFMDWAFMSPLTIFTTFKGYGSPSFRRRLQKPPPAVCHCGNCWSHVTLGLTYFFSRDLYEIATKSHWACALSVCGGSFKIAILHPDLTLSYFGRGRSG